MSAPKKYTEADRRAVLRLRRKGMSIRAIAERLSMSVGSVNAITLAASAPSPEQVTTPTGKSRRATSNPTGTRAATHRKAIEAAVAALGFEEALRTLLDAGKATGQISGRQIVQVIDALDLGGDDGDGADDDRHVGWGCIPPSPAD